MINGATINGFAVNGTGVYSENVWAISESFLGLPHASVFSYPALASNIPDGITTYTCTLTGSADSLDDVVLPMSSFSVRHRVDSASYYSIVIPSYAYVDDITDRPNGEIVIEMDVGGVVEEISRGSLGDVRTDRGPKSQSITISGNASRAETTHATYTLSTALYAYTTFDGEARLRINPRAAMRPGDTVSYQDILMEVGLVTWAVSASGATMEIAAG